MEWQPMATAPRDGSVILLANGREVTAGLYGGNAKYPWVVLDNGNPDGTNGWQDGECGPDHWMPMPDQNEA